MTLTFYTDGLLHDIANYSYVEGDIMSGDNIHAQHHTQDIIAEGNIDRVYRVLGLSHAEVTEMLYPFSKSLATSTSLDNKENQPGKYEIEITPPVGFSETTLQLLRHLIHEYMVSAVLADWLSITNPNSAPNWEAKKEALKHRIKTCLTNRTGKLTRKMSPF